MSGLKPPSLPRHPGNQSRRFPPSHLCRRHGRSQSPPPIIGGGRGWQEIWAESWACRRYGLHRTRVPPPLWGLEDGIQYRSYFVTLFSAFVLVRVSVPRRPATSLVGHSSQADLRMVAAALPHTLPSRQSKTLFGSRSGWTGKTARWDK